MSLYTGRVSSRVSSLSYDFLPPARILHGQESSTQAKPLLLTGLTGIKDPVWQESTQVKPPLLIGLTGITLLSFAVSTE